MNSLYKNAKEHTSIRTESRVILIFLGPFSDSVLNFYNFSWRKLKTQLSENSSAAASYLYRFSCRNFLKLKTVRDMGSIWNRTLRTWPSECDLDLC